MMRKFLGIALTEFQHRIMLTFSGLFILDILLLLVNGFATDNSVRNFSENIGLLLMVVVNIFSPLILGLFRVHNGEGLIRSAFGAVLKPAAVFLITGAAVLFLYSYKPDVNCKAGACGFDAMIIILPVLVAFVQIPLLLLLAGMYKHFLKKQPSIS